MEMSKAEHLSTECIMDWKEEYKAFVMLKSSKLVCYQCGRTDGIITQITEWGVKYCVLCLGRSLVRKSEAGKLFNLSLIEIAAVKVRSHFPIDTQIPS